MPQRLAFGNTGPSIPPAIPAVIGRTLNVKGSAKPKPNTAASTRSSSFPPPPLSYLQMQRPPPNANNNCCPKCSNHLVPKFAKGGEVPNSWYIRAPAKSKIVPTQCDYPHQDGLRFFYRFPPMPATNPPTPSPTAAFQSPLPLSAPSSVPLKSKCPHPSCKSTRVPGACTHRMCRRHCVLVGPCMDPGHNTFYLNQLSTVTTPASAAVPPLPSYAPPPTSGPRFFSSFDDMQAYSTAPSHALAARQAKEDSRKTEDLRLLDLAVGYKLPSPDVPMDEALELMDQEQRDLELATRLSLGLPSFDTPSDDTARPSSSVPPAGGPSTLRDLSLSPYLPATLMPDINIQHLPALGGANAPEATNKRPHRRVPAQSVAARQKPTPRITTQLNPTWMAMGNTSTAAPTSQAAAAPSSVLHVRREPGRLPFVDPRVDERFPLIYWDQANELPKVIFVDSIITWPTFVLAHNPSTLARLGTNIIQLELYCPQYTYWVAITVDFVHEVASNSPILPPPAAPHLRYNLPRERKLVREKYKEITSVETDGGDSDDSEVVVIKETIDLSQSKGKKRARQASNTPSSPPLRHRPRLNTNRSSSPLSAVSTSSESVPSSTADTSAPTSPSTSTSSPPWPADMFVVEMAQGFHTISTGLKNLKNRGARFVHVFGKEYRPSTYDDQVKKWKTASASLKHTALTAGKTEAGSWASFSRAVRAEQDALRNV
ncbi:hypothetical protein C8J57DRAFT_1468491 [Mycena rebaudengoi]|nr:hypothetical protein C8J57DRAFT_1468491 [Mycena rebaudengoi]